MILVNLMLLFLFCFGLQSTNLNDIKKIVKLSEVGYQRQLWDEEKVHVSIKCIEGKIKTYFKIYKNNKIQIKLANDITQKEYMELWEYIYSNDILNIKNAAYLNGTLTDDEFRKLYKKIPRQYSYIYCFSITIGNKKTSFTVDDIGYILDSRYLELLNEINGILKIKTEINVFGENSKQ